MYDSAPALYEKQSRLNNRFHPLAPFTLPLQPESLTLMAHIYHMKKSLIFALLLAAGSLAQADNYTVTSPNQRIRVDVATGGITTYKVAYDGKIIISPSPLSMTFDNGMVIGRNMKVKDVENTTLNTVIKPVVRQKSETAAALPVPQPTSPEAEVLVDNGHEQLFTLLLVDDNADMLSFLHDVLKEHYRVRCATNGREALDMMKQPLPDLVVSDVMMPVMDGLELCRRIKGDLRTSHVPVILLTAKGRTEDQVEGLDSGADLYLPKPFSTEVIRAQISSLLRNRERVKAQYQSEPLACPELSSGSSLDKEFMERVNAIIERRMTDSDFSVDLLAQEVGISRTGLFTKIKALFGMTPNDFIRLNRLKKAAALLAQGDVPVSEACWQVGFSSTSYFSKCFQSQFGVTPNEFRHGKK